MHRTTIAWHGSVFHLDDRGELCAAPMLADGTVDSRHDVEVDWTNSDDRAAFPALVLLLRGAAAIDTDQQTHREGRR